MNKPSLENEGILRQSLEHLNKRWRSKLPTTAMICGSGWGEITAHLKVVDEIPFKEIKCLSDTTVDGHTSNLLLIETKIGYAMIYQGRRHYYEGVGWGTVRIPVILAKEIGCGTLILTNAAGGISDFLNVGDIMMIEDHINLMNGNPLIGEGFHPQIPRFPDQTEIYNKKLIYLAEKIASKMQISLKKGVYLALMGPAFETPAEIRAFQTIGADAIGMSTAPEAMIANALNMKVLGLSCISNKAAGLSDSLLSHEEVAENTTASLPSMQKLIEYLLNEIE